MPATIPFTAHRASLVNLTRLTSSLLHCLCTLMLLIDLTLLAFPIDMFDENDFYPKEGRS